MSMVTGSRKVLTGGDFNYLGSFLPPVGYFWSGAAYTFSYRASGCGYGPKENTLYLSGSVQDAGPQNLCPLVAEVKIPPDSAFSKNPNPETLFRASLAHGFTDVTGGLYQQVLDQAEKAPGGGPTHPLIGGLLVYKGYLYFSVWAFYDGATAVKTFVGRTPLPLGSGKPQGLFGLNAGVPAGALAGWLAEIPPEWRPVFGNYPAYCGLAGVPIAGRTSSGPAMVGFNPTMLGKPPAQGKAFLFYPLDSPVSGWDAANGTSTLRGSAFISTPTKVGTIFLGTQKTGGPSWYGGPTSPDGRTDPCSQAKGEHAEGRTPVLWVYDPAEVAVRGPATIPALYDFGGIHSPNPSYVNNPCARGDDLAYDPIRRRLYLVQNGAFTPEADSYNHYPVVHVYGVLA